MKRSLAILAVIALLAAGCSTGGLVGSAMGSAALLGADTVIGTATSGVLKSKEEREREKAFINSMTEQKKAARQWRSQMSTGTPTGQEKTPTDTTEDLQNPQ
jgi:hypothetical protein